MTLALVDETDLLTALYDGVMHRPIWRVFVERVRARTEAQGCAIWIRPIAEDHWRLAQADGMTQSPPAEIFAQINMMRPNRVYSAGELQATPQWHGRYMRGQLPGEAELAIALLRSSAGVDFRARDSALLSSLSSHLLIALQILVRMEGLQICRLMAADATEGFGLGWIALDARGQVVEVDPTAAKMIDEGRFVRQTGDGRLRFVHDSAETMLESVLRTPDLLQAGPRAAWLATEPPIQATVEMVAACELLSRSTTRFLLQFREIEQSHDRNCELAMALFGLGRSEASLALHLANGLTIAEAGKELGLTLETARNYSKRIYAKTGTNGQGQLVSLLMRGMTARVSLPQNERDYRRTSGPPVNAGN